MLDNKRRRQYPIGGLTNVTLLLDASGSMDVRRDETIREVNNYLDKLREDGQRYKITVAVFNERTDFLISRKDIRDVGQLEHSEYRPEGWTRLLDSVGLLLESFRYSDSHYRNLVVVITDGQENRSRDYSLQQVRRLIDERRSENFQFVFLGSGPDSWSVGQNLGFNISVATDYYNPFNIPNIYKGLYNATNSYSTTGVFNSQMLNSTSTSAKVTNES
jgi:Mg-chelatase subunit ChlD